MNKHYEAIKEKYPCVIDVPWPVRDLIDADGIPYRETDPNETLRLVLESEVGTQGTEWNWCVCPHKDNFLSVGMHDSIIAVKIKLEWS